jgi:hypothetical protein
MTVRRATTMPGVGREKSNAPWRRRCEVQQRGMHLARSKCLVGRDRKLRLAIRTPGVGRCSSARRAGVGGRRATALPGEVPDRLTQTRVADEAIRDSSRGRQGMWARRPHCRGRRPVRDGIGPARDQARPDEERRDLNRDTHPLDQLAARGRSRRHHLCLSGFGRRVGRWRRRRRHDPHGSRSAALHRSRRALMRVLGSVERNDEFRPERHDVAAAGP